MSLLSMFAKKPLLSEDDTSMIVEAIRAGEKKTSGEIRVYVESHCRFVDALDRAAEVFSSLQMDATETGMPFWYTWPLKINNWLFLQTKAFTKRPAKGSGIKR